MNAVRTKVAKYGFALVALCMLLIFAVSFVDMAIARWASIALFVVGFVALAVRLVVSGLDRRAP